MSPTILDEIMTKEGLSNAELGRFADLNEKTISKARAGRNGSKRTCGKLIRGLNSNPNKLDKTHEYKIEELFPGL